MPVDKDFDYGAIDIHVNFEFTGFRWRHGKGLVIEQYLAGERGIILCGQPGLFSYQRQRKRLGTSFHCAANLTAALFQVHLGDLPLVLFFVRGDVENLRLLAEGVDRRSNADAELAVVVQGQNAGQRTQPPPAGGAIFRKRAGFRDPAPEDPVSGSFELSFGRVERSVVENALPARMEEQLFGVQIAALPVGLALTGIDEDMLVAERKEIRALPHIAGIDGIGAVRAASRSTSNDVEVFPVVQILGAVEQDRSALAADARADHHVPGIALAPRRGVAGAGYIDPRRRRGDDRLRHLRRSW